MYFISTGIVLEILNEKFKTKKAEDLHSFMPLRLKKRWQKVYMNKKRNKMIFSQQGQDLQ